MRLTCPVDRQCSSASASTSGRSHSVACRAQAGKTTEKPPVQPRKKGFDLQDLLGPIGLALQGGNKQQQQQQPPAVLAERPPGGDAAENASIHGMSTAEWRQAYEQAGGVDLWVEEEFNAGSRLTGGRDAHKGHTAGFGSGEGPSAGTAARHRVKIHNHFAHQEVEVEVPEDRYILWEAEEQGLILPHACRMGCCTACAVKVKSGRMHQPQSLGISAELKERGYGLMCVGYAETDLELETVDEDEVYDLQFGRVFAEQATNPSDRRFVSRDDFAIELADMDE